jgi:hypothetical protein
VVLKYATINEIIFPLNNRFMQWFLAKIVYRIICGEGNHAAQFDEQLRLIKAGFELEAIEKAMEIGMNEQQSFFNEKEQLVKWQFITVSEIYELNQLNEGAEVYSHILETESADAYVKFVSWKADRMLENNKQQLLRII